MIIEQTIRDSQLTLKPLGRLDSSTAGDLDAKIKEISVDGISTMIIDMSEVDYISSKGVRVLVSAYRKMQGREMILTGVNDSVREVLNLSGLLKVFRINP